MAKIDKKELLHRSKLALRVLAVAWRVRPWAIVGYFFGALLEVAGFIVAIYASSQLAGLLARYIAGGDTSAIWLWLAVDVVAGIAIALAFWVMSWAQRMIYFRLTVWAIDSFQSALCRLDIPDFYDAKIRNKINKVQGGYAWRISGLCDSMLDLVYALIRFIAMATIVAQISWWLIPLIALTLVPTLLVNRRITKLQWFVWDTKGDDRHIFWGLDWLMRRPVSQMELRSSQAKGYVLDRIHKMNTKFYSKQESEFSKPNRFMAPAEIIRAGGGAVGSVLALLQFLAGSIGFERYLFLTGALARVGGALNTIFGTLTRMQEPLLFAEDFFDIIDRQPKYVDVAKPRPLSGASAPEIVFDNVSFTYPGQSKPVFQGLSFTIAAGEHVAIVGENGVGKTTMIKLLMRFYKPSKGRILIDGKDLSKISIETWYNLMATLFQEFNHYPLSIRENIEIARPKLKSKKQYLLDAANFSNVDSFVKDYKHGWQTVLDNSFKKGVEPSGGQWQRVALARAFYRQAAVLILDEPTAAIDAKAEYDIFNNIFTHFKNKTAIIVSHRFSTVRRADTIIVVNHGKIVERGSHQELIKHGGLYHEMFSKQAEGYRD